MANKTNVELEVERRIEKLESEKREKQRKESAEFIAGILAMSIYLGLIGLVGLGLAYIQLNAFGIGFVCAFSLYLVKDSMEKFAKNLENEMVR